MSSVWNGLRRSPMQARKVRLVRRAIRRPRLSAEVRAFVMERDNQTCRYCGAKAIHIDHVIRLALRRRYQLPHDDPAFLVASCGPCNWRKGTLNLAPRGFDLALLPGRGWRHWAGGPIR